MCSFQSSKTVFELAVNGFRKSFSVKPVCLAVTENRISGKWFQFDRNFTPLTRKWFYTFILPSNHFRVTRKRERESERKRKKEELAEIVQSFDRRDRLPKSSAFAQSWSTICAIVIAIVRSTAPIAISPSRRSWSREVFGFDDFFSGFCLCFCIEKWMILYIRLATEKIWENVSNK